MSHFEGPRSSVDRYSGGTDKQQADAQAEMARRFETQKLEDLRRMFERPKTPETLELIDVVNGEVEKLREKYGLPSRTIPPDNYHLISMKGRELIGSPAYFDILEQNLIFVETKTRAEMARNLLHETIHAQSFGAVYVHGDNLDQHRVGLTILKVLPGREKFNYGFNPLNEAVTEGLTKRIMRDAVEKTPSLKDEATRLREAREIAAGDVAFIETGEPDVDGFPEEKFYSYDYPEARQALDLLIEKLRRRGPEPAQGREEWFDKFARAMFTGDLKEIGQAVEKTFGQGAFKKLGEQADGSAFLEFVESL